MRAATHLGKTQAQIKAMIFRKLDPRFQFQTLQTHLPRPFKGLRHHQPAQTPALQIRLDRQFAQIQGPLDRFQDHAGLGGLTQNPNLTRGGQPLRGQAVQR